MTYLLAASLTDSTQRLLMLGGAAVILYVMGRLVMGAIPRAIDGSTLRALLGFLTVLTVSVTATIVGRPEVGLHLPIAAATGTLTFGMAATILGRGVIGGASIVSLRSWMLVLPAVALTLIGGYAGRVDPMFLGILALFGVTALTAWLPDRQAPRTVPVAVDAPAAPIPAATFAQTPVGEPAVALPPTTPPHHPPVAHVAAASSHAFAMVVWVGSIALAALAGVLAMKGVPALESMRHVSADALVTVFLIAPACVVPMIFELLPPCRPIGWSASVSTLAKFVVMCLCLAIPLTALVAADREVIRGWLSIAETTPGNGAIVTTMPSTSPTSVPATMSTAAIASTQPTIATTPQIIFPSLPNMPLSADLLVLAAASLMLLPLASGWLRPGKLEAGALFACYLLNLLLVIRTIVS